MGSMPMSIPGMPEFSHNFIGGSNNGLNLSGAWASGGFNTQGATPATGFQQFSGTSPSGTGLFGLPASNFSAFGGITVPGVGFPGMTGGPNTAPGANNQYGFNPNTGLPTFGAPGIGASPATQGPFPQIDTNALKKLYGSGVGGALSQFLNTGAGFNPQVIQAQINEAMPLEAHALAKMSNLFGDTGNAYSSTAALGYGDFESQFNAALEGQFAQEYQQSVQNYLDVLMRVAPSAQQQQAQGMNWMSVLSSLAGAAGAGITAGSKGGATAGLGAALGAL